MNTEKLSHLHRFEAVSGEVAKAPTLLLLHGTGGSENDLLGLGRALAPNANLLSPRGQVLEGNMPRFFRRLAEGVFDLDDLRVRTDQLAEFVREATRAYHLGSNKIFALGYSNGANIAANLLIRHPTLLRGAALLRAMLPYQPEEKPRLDGRKVLLLSGARDPLIRREQVDALEECLRRAGAVISRREDPNAGHGLTEEEIPYLREWMHAAMAEAE